MTRSGISGLYQPVLQGLSFWAQAVLLAIKSGKGVLSLFTRQHKHWRNIEDSQIDWLSVADTVAQYGDDHTDTTE